VTSPHLNFPATIQQKALARQKYKCASCETPISDIGERGRETHRFGERVEGHHVIPHKLGGPISCENCVVLCRSCHYSAHQAGHWRDASIYDDLKLLPMQGRIKKVADMYPSYEG
jgi:hypothetical protein